jgi:hypothetical protein
MLPPAPAARPPEDRYARSVQPLEIARALAFRLAWFAVVVLLAFGAAGIVAAMDHVPGTEARPELTWPADAEVTPALAVATAELEALGDAVADLATTARAALASVTSVDPDRLEAAIEQGDAQLAEIAGRAEAFNAAVDAVPWMGAGSDLSVATGLRTRHAYLEESTTLTDGLDAAWAALDNRAITGARVAALLLQHDEQTASAAVAGTEGRYTDALAILDTSDATIAETRALVDTLAGTTDTTVLVEWLDRNAAYDAALRALYVAVIEAEGRATTAVTRAIDAELAARARLPGDTRALVVIMSDIAQGGLNQAVVTIERTRGELAGALELQRELEAEITVPE